jgi:hypothetical protein
MNSVIHALSETHDAGLMYHITLTMDLFIPQMKIISMKAEMPAVPDNGCHDIRDAVQKCTGLSIRPGLTNETLNIPGNTSGCRPLANIIIFKSSAADQGGSYCCRIREGCTALPLQATDGSMLIDSSYVSRENGPVAEKIRHRNTGENGNKPQGRGEIRTL